LKAKCLQKNLFTVYRFDIFVQFPLTGPKAPVDEIFSTIMPSGKLCRISAK